MPFTYRNLDLGRIGCLRICYAFGRRLSSHRSNRDSRAPQSLCSTYPFPLHTQKHLAKLRAAALLLFVIAACPRRKLGDARYSHKAEQSGHFATEFQCPLLGVKRTLRQLVAMSAYDPKRTWPTSRILLPVSQLDPYDAGS